MNALRHPRLLELGVFLGRFFGERFHLGLLFGESLARTGIALRVEFGSNCCWAFDVDASGALRLAAWRKSRDENQPGAE
jgi:hypothetical protein